MIANLSLLMITYNGEEILEKSLQSCKDLVDEIVVVDNYSTDKTGDIAKKYGAKIYFHREYDLGKQRAYGLKKVSGEWVLVLDSDEMISKGLQREIVSLFHGFTDKPPLKSPPYKGGEKGEVAYLIPFQNHFLGRLINYGGENYKMLRLFKKNSIEIKSALVHESFKLKRGISGVLKNKIYHYSYRSLWQTFRKFTDYSVREARQKVRKGEKTSLKKIILYPLHMFWARFIKDKGYKDGIFRIPLDLGFAYMEFLTYVLILFYSWSKLKIKN